MRCTRGAAGRRRTTRPGSPSAHGVGGRLGSARLLLGSAVLALVAAVMVSAVLAVLGSPSSAAALPLAAPARASADAGSSGGLPASAGWPLDGSPLVTRGFDPPATRWGSGHRGVDLAGRVGQPVLAAADGTVRFAGRVAGVGVVVIDHGGVRTTYQPVEATVAVGRPVSRGAEIGRLSAGHCGAEAPPAACLHWGLVRGSTYLDPLLLLPGDEEAATESYRLLPATEIAAVRARQAAALAASLAGPLGSPDSPGSPGSPGSLGSLGPLGPLGPPGRHGFAHPVPGAITSPFGRRFHPILHVWKLHDGTDFGAGCGTSIRAPYPGRVVAQYANAGYGNRLMLDHGVVDGHHVITGYNHAIRYVVGVGSTVRRGELIGFVGETGYATGCHLHLMVWIDGQLVDPMRWF